MSYLSLEILTLLLVSQRSCICPPQVSPAHSLICLIGEWATPRRALASSVEERTPRTPASSGALTPAPGMSISLLMLGDIITSPGPLAAAQAHTSWVVATVRAAGQLPLSDLAEHRNQVSLLNIMHSKCSML